MLLSFVETNRNMAKEQKTFLKWAAVAEATGIHNTKLHQFKNGGYGVISDKELIKVRTKIEEDHKATLDTIAAAYLFHRLEYTTK